MESNNPFIKTFFFFFEKLQEYISFFTRKIRNTEWIPEFPPIHLLHFYVVIISIIITIIAYIKIKYPFWNIQPVYHTYDFWRYFYKNPFQVQRNRANKYTKFYQKKRVKTIKYTDANVSDNIKDVFVDKLQCYYLLSEDVMFIMNTSQLDTILNGHIDAPAFISLYMDTVYKKDFKESQKEPLIQSEDLPVAGMVSYPICFKYKNTQQISHYWEYIWINRVYRKRNIQRILLQTHDCKVRDMHPEIQTSIFKKSDILCEGIVPIVKYDSYITKIAYHKYVFPKSMVLTRIYNHYDTLFDVLENSDLNVLFDLQLHPCIPNIQSQIKKEQIIVYCLKHKEQVVSIYFFKETFSLTEHDNSRILRLVSSICNSRNASNHIAGYMYCIRNIIRHIPIKYGYIAIDALSHNHIIINYLKLSKEKATKNAIYSYNYIIPQSPVHPQRTLAIL
jgi:hypothetical protein